MKKFILPLFISFSAVILFAQDVTLSDSVIYINNKPVALYYKELSQTPPRYNVKVYNFNKDLLVQAEIIKFNAPVNELQPFYYYELTFPLIPDTFAIYVEDEAFTLVLSKVIRDYNLITGNQLNKVAVANFKANYPGGPALFTKIKSFEIYLNETRNFNSQITRDRTKPVTIKSDRIIMQDGKKIGTISFDAATIYQDPNPTSFKSSNQLQESFQVRLLNGDAIDLSKLGGGANWYTFNINKYEYGEQLFEISFLQNKSKVAANEYYIRRLCYLIENYAL